MVEVRDLTKSYPSARGRLEVLRGVDFSLEAGESAALVGPSGCGKSTLLHILGGLDTADSGQATVGGVALNGLDDAGQTRLRREVVGFVFQFFHLLPTLTVRENVELPALVAGGDQRVVAKRAEQLLEAVGLAERARHRPHQLSGGEMQRCAIARALINRPKLLLADEPTGNLDSATGTRILEMLLELQRAEGLTLLLVTHSESLAQSMGRTMRMRDGLLVN
jgi:predicted ABC-type transport system involved in lysophospholipase L1 biosynthesis ATPase subunit